jgi:hypothetical protein
MSALAANVLSARVCGNAAAAPRVGGATRRVALTARPVHAARTARLSPGRRGGGLRTGPGVVSMAIVAPPAAGAYTRPRFRST